MLLAQFNDFSNLSKNYTEHAWLKGHYISDMLEVFRQSKCTWSAGHTVNSNVTIRGAPIRYSGSYRFDTVLFCWIVVSV